MHEWSVTLPLRLQLGEGLCWDAELGRLWFVDIEGRRLLNWRPGDGDWREWATPQKIGWAIPRRSGQGLMVGLQQGVAAVTPGEAFEFTWVTRIFDEASPLRMNDAKADATGAIWAGSLNSADESRSDGGLFRIDPVSGAVRRVDEGYTVANGPAIHPEGRLMLHTDSGRRTIYAFNLDAAEGRVTGRRVWKAFEPHEGYPDGMNFDAEGCVWVAHWGAGCISRFTAGGRLLRRVSLPTSHITNVCFGGADLDRLFVTSARAGLTDEQLGREPLAGALFEVDAGGARGLPALRCG